MNASALFGAGVRRLVDSNIVGVFIWDLDGRILEANDAFLDMLQYGRDDLVSGGLRWTDLTPRAATRQVWRPIARGRSSASFRPVRYQTAETGGPVCLAARRVSTSGTM